MVVVVAVAEGRGGCSWCCRLFFGRRIYYFTVMVILFYYCFIVLKAKIDPLLQHVCR